MSLGSNTTRNDSKENKSIAANLKKHAELTAKYIEQGMTAKEAGKKAFNDIKRK